MSIIFRKRPKAPTQTSYDQDEPPVLREPPLQEEDDDTFPTLQANDMVSSQTTQAVVSTPMANTISAKVASTENRTQALTNTIPNLSSHTPFDTPSALTALSTEDITDLQANLAQWLDNIIEEELHKAQQRIKVRVIAQLPTLLSK